MKQIPGGRFLPKNIPNGLAQRGVLRFDVKAAIRAVVCSAISIGFLIGVAGAKIQVQTQTSNHAVENSGNPESGRRLYVSYGCYECHGFEGQGGGSAGPRIGPDPIPLSALIAYVREPAREMPPYTDKVVSDKELSDIYAFLKSRPNPPTASSNPLLH